MARRSACIGGQALAFWADHLQVERPESLVSGVTADADFIGDAVLATNLGKRLGWQTSMPSLEDSTPQTGKVTHRTKSGEVKQVDFLSGVVGLTTKDLNRRALEMDIPDLGRLRVVHPVDVLDSRIQNLHLLPEKRNDAGIAQARLALVVVRVSLLFGIDPLEAVPLEKFRTTTALHKVRWPQILPEVNRKRDSMRKLAAGVSRRDK